METEQKIIHTGRTGPLEQKGKKRKRAIAILIIIVLAVGIGIGFRTIGMEKTVTVSNYTKAVVVQQNMVSTVEASGTVVYPTQVTIVSPEEGYVDQLYVSEGDEIALSDVLCVIDIPELDDEIDDLNINLTKERVALEELILNYKYSILELERSTDRLIDDVTEAEEEAETLKSLAQLKSSRESDYEDSLDNLELLQEELQDTTSDLEKERQAKDLAIRKQEAVIAQMEINLAQALEDLDDSRVKSPISGHVMSINESLSVRGSELSESEELFIIANMNEVYLDLDVYEQYVSQLQVGSRMLVTVGTTSFEAEITHIGKIATMDSDGLSAMITVRAVPAQDVSLTMGASAVATITLGSKENTLILPRASYLTTGSQKYVYKVDGDKAYKTTVTFGEIQGSQVEVLSGLEAGDTIISSGYQDFIDQDVISISQKENKNDKT